MSDATPLSLLIEELKGIDLGLSPDQIKTRVSDIIASASLEHYEGRTPGTTVLYSGTSDGISGWASALELARANPDSIRIIDDTVASRATMDPYWATLMVRMFGDTASPDARNFMTGADPSLNDGRPSIFSNLSSRFAADASGVVYTFSGSGTGVDRIFAVDELPAILHNDNVTHINGVPRSALLNAWNTDVANGPPAGSPVELTSEKFAYNSLLGKVNAAAAFAFNGADTATTPEGVRYYVNTANAISQLEDLAKADPSGFTNPSTPSNATPGHSFLGDQSGTFNGGANFSSPEFRTDVVNLYNDLKSVPNLVNKLGHVGTMIGVVATAAEVFQRLEAGDEKGAAYVTGSFVMSEVGAILGGVVATAVIGAVVAAFALPALAAGAIVFAGAVVFSIVGGIFGQTLWDAGWDFGEWLSGGPDWLEGDGAFYNAPISPLVFDLDGDGLDLVHLRDSSAFFDLNENGLAEHTAWIGSDDGFLALDKNANGSIDDLSELFGGQDIDGFTTLSAHDSNHDGVIDGQDAVYEELLVWRDADGDGVTDEGELVGLEEVGIASIDLAAVFVNKWIGGNWISHSSTFTNADGTHGVVDDIWFENDQVRTVNRNFTSADISQDARLMPELAGYGTLANLSMSLTYDSNLRGVLTELILRSSTQSAVSLRAELEAFVLTWAGVDDVVAGSRGNYVDARHLTFLEVVHGQDFSGYGGITNPGPNASAALEGYFDRVMGSFVGKLAAQIPMSLFWLTGDPQLADSHPLELLSTFRYDRPTDTLVPSPGALTYRIEDALATGVPGIRAAIEMVGTLAAFGVNATVEGQDLVPWIVAQLLDSGVDNALVEFLQAAIDSSFLIGTASSEGLTGGSGRDAFIGGAGDDQLNGLGGNDTYLWARGDGADVITENYSGVDKLVLEGVLASEVSVVRSGTTTNVRLLIAESAPGAGDGGSVQLVSSLDGSSGVEQVVFADGTVWTQTDMRLMVLAQASTAGADVITGFTTADVIRAGVGDDQLNGAGGNDTYLWARGDGAGNTSSVRRIIELRVRLVGSQMVEGT